MQLDVRSISYIDDRGFPGVEGVLVPGPAGYQSIIVAEAIVVAQNVFFVLNNWLADGFLVSSFLVLRSLIHAPNASPSSSIVAMLCTP